MQFEATFEDRRLHPRKVVRIGARAIIANSEATVDCTILDVSGSGAKLEMQNIDTLQTRLKLFIPEMDRIVDCEVAWRDGNHLGVSFLNYVSL